MLCYILFSGFATKKIVVVVVVVIIIYEEKKYSNYQLKKIKNSSYQLVMFCVQTSLDEK